MAAKKKAPEVVEGYSELIDVYWKEFENAIGVAPVFTARIGKAAKDMLKAMGLERATQCVRNAFKDEWFVTHCRELHHIALNANKYLVAPSVSKAAPRQPQRPAQPTSSGSEPWRERLN